MKFDKILQFQKIDQEHSALKAEINKSEKNQRYLAAQARVEAATTSISTLTDEANDLVKSYDVMKSKMKALESEIAEFDGILEDVDDISEAEYYLKLVSAISDKLSALEKEANAVASKIDQINATYAKTWEQGIRATHMRKIAKAEYDALEAEYKGKFNELNQKLNALAKEIPENELNEYLTRRKSIKLPIYVEYDADNKICSRCRMEVPNDVRSKLKAAGDSAECPNCHRIMFVPENK